MSALLAITATEFRILRRNRWLVIATALLSVFALALTLAGATTSGALGVDLLTVFSRVDDHLGGLSGAAGGLADVFRGHCRGCGTRVAGFGSDLSGVAWRVAGRQVPCASAGPRHRGRDWFWPCRGAGLCAGGRGCVQWIGAAAADARGGPVGGGLYRAWLCRVGVQPVCLQPPPGGLGSSGLFWSCFMIWSCWRLWSGTMAGCSAARSSRGCWRQIRRMPCGCSASRRPLIRRWSTGMGAAVAALPQGAALVSLLLWPLLGLGLARLVFGRRVP